jgi:hypothetical protein
MASIVAATEPESTPTPSTMVTARPSALMCSIKPCSCSAPRSTSASSTGSQIFGFAFSWIATVGVAKLYLGDDEEAVAWLRRAIEINRNLPNAHFYLAAALANLGQLNEAQAAALAGLAINPTYTINGFRAGSSSDNPTFLAQRERIYKGLQMAGVPEG